jgi:iron complex outermembrane recepter protein
MQKPVASDSSLSGAPRRRSYSLALGIGLALASAAATAQQQPATTGALEEVVVTAQFRREKLQETPLAITALSGDALTDRNITNLVDVGQAAPNVTMFENAAAYGKTNAAFIRGIGQGDFNFASAEPGVGIYIDDVYHATTFGSMFDLLDLDRVEVLRGPQGTLFGKNSIGGAIRLISKKPTGDGSGFAEVTAGDYNRREMRAGFDVALSKDVLMLRVTGMSKQRDGYVDRLDFACAHPTEAGNIAPQLLGTGSCVTGHQGGVDIKGARLQLRWVASDSVENNFTADVLDDNSEAAAETLLVADPNLAPALAGFNSGTLIPNYGIPYDSRFVAAGTYKTYSNFADLLNQRSYPAVNTVHSYGFGNVLDWTIVPTVHLKSITGYRGYWGDFSDDQSNSPLPVAYAYNMVDHHQFTQEFQLTGKAFNERLDWATGLFYYDGFSLNRGHVNLNFFGSFPPTAVVPIFPTTPQGNGVPVLDFDQNDPAHTKDKAAFAQATFAFTDQLHGTGGIRYTKEDKDYTFNHYNSEYPTFINPALDLRGVTGATSYNHTDWKLGLDYQVTRDLMVYGSASTGFRGGGLNPRPFTNLQVLPFSPEKLTEYEVGMKSEWFDHKLRANLAAYFGKYQDVVTTSQTVDLSGAPTTAPQNVGSADIKGFELEVDATPVENFTASLTVGLTDYKWKDLGNSVGCQDVANPVPGIGGNCINGNPGYGDLSPGTPKWTSSLGLQYAIPLGAGGWLTPRLDAAYHSARYNNYWNNYNPVDPVTGQATGIAETPSMTLLNGRITWEDAGRTWAVTLFGTNLTNKYYYQSFLDLRAFGEGQMLGMPGEPREWGVTLRRKF